MNELNCKYCDTSTSCGEEAVAVTCYLCVTNILSGNNPDNINNE